MPYLILVTIVWAFSFSLIGQYLAGRVDSDFAVLMRVAIAALVFIPFTRWRNLPWRLLGGFWLAGATYFGKVYTEAVELCVYLCKQYNLTEKDIICHSEGHTLGIASNHGDVMHWFPKHGKSMDTFRAAVKAGLAATETPAEPTTPKKYYRVQLGAFSVKANADAMLKKVKATGFTDAFVKYSE